MQLSKSMSIYTRGLKQGVQKVCKSLSSILLIYIKGPKRAWQG